MGGAEESNGANMGTIVIEQWIKIFLIKKCSFSFKKNPRCLKNIIFSATSLVVGHNTAYDQLSWFAQDKDISQNTGLPELKPG